MEGVTAGGWHLHESPRQGKGLPACIHAHTHLKAALAFAQQLREIWGFSLCMILWGYLCQHHFQGTFLRSFCSFCLFL